MKRFPRLIILGFVVAVFLSQTSSSKAKTVTVRVGMTGDSFSPGTVTITVGDEIEWIWGGSFHSTTSGTPGHASGLWNSGVLNAGATFHAPLR